MVEKSSSNAATLFDDLSNIDKQFNALYLEENPDNGTEGLAGEMEMDSREDVSHFKASTQHEATLIPIST